MPDKQTIFEKVREMVVDRFGVNESTVTPEMSFVDLGADSLDLVEFVMLVEDTFKLSFENKTISELNTIEDAVSYIYQKLNDEQS